MMGPVCSNWLWVCASSTKRSVSNGNLGDTSIEKVAQSNEMNRRVSFWIIFAQHLGISWLLEQTQNSSFCKTAHMQTALGATGAKKISFDMFAFGHSAVKPTQLWGTLHWLPELASLAKESNYVEKQLRTPEPLTTHYLKDGVRKVDGKLSALSQSQAYPPKFCLEVLKLHFPGKFAGQY